MAKANRTGIMMLAIVALVLTAVAIIATLGVTMLVTEAPRSFTTWFLSGFLCMVWFLIGVLSIQNIAAKRYQYSQSGATVLFVWLMIGMYAFVGLVTIVAFMVFSEETEARDRMLMGILIGESVVFFIAAFYFYSFSDYIESREHVTMVKRAEHRSQSFSVSEIMADLKSFKCEGTDQLARMEIFQKKLRSCETILKHSHGGGVGSYEGAGKHWGNMASETADIEQLINSLRTQTAGLQSGGAADFDEAIENMDQTLASLNKAISSLELA